MNLANSTFFTIARILFPTGEMFTDGAEMSRHLPSTRTTFDTVVTSMLFMPPAMRALQMSEMTTFISLLILTSFRDVVAVMAWIELCATRESHSAVSLITFYWSVLNLGSGCLCFMFLSIVLSSQLLLLMESRFGWVLFAGIPNNDNSSLGYIWPKEWPFISFKHIKLGKSRYTRRFTPAKVRAHSNCKVTVSRHF